MRRLAVALAAVVALASSAGAEVLTSKTGKVSIEPPAGWKVDAKGDVMLTLADPTGEVGVLFLVVNQADLKKAGDALDAELAKVAKDIEWSGKPKQVQINGMPGVAVEGVASVQGVPMKLGAIFLKTPADKGLAVIAMVAAATHEKHKPEIKALFATLKPAP